MPRLILFVALPILLAACSSGSPPPAAIVAGPAQPQPVAPSPPPEAAPVTREQLLDRFVGDWIVTEASPDPMQVQTNVWIRREGGQLAVFEGGDHELTVRTVSVDAVSGVVSLVETLPDSEVGLTLAPATSTTLDAVKPDIVMTWQGGARWTLTGGWQRGKDDHSTGMIAFIRERGRRLTYRIDSSIRCYVDLNFRYDTLCKDETLSRLHFDLMSKFESISGEYPDSHRTYQAAIRNLDACADRPCLVQRYQDWSRYLDDNYPHQQAVD